MPPEPPASGRPISDAAPPPAQAETAAQEHTRPLTPLEQIVELRIRADGEAVMPSMQMNALRLEVRAASIAICEVLKEATWLLAETVNVNEHERRKG